MYHTAFVPFQSLFFEYLENHEKHDMQVLQYHDTYEVYLQTLGERYFFLNDISYTLKPGDLYLVKPFQMHFCQSRSSLFYGRYVVNFPENKLELLLSPSERELLFRKLRSGVLHLKPMEYEHIVSIFKGLGACYGQNSFLSEKLQYSYIMQMLLAIKEYIHDEIPQSASNDESDFSTEIIHAINYINMHYQEPLTLNSVTAQIHISKYHFCRVFRQTTGATFLEYLTDIRLTKAHQMLLETNLTLAEIARRTGFSSTSHLSRIFRSAYHVSPTEFRRTHNNSTAKS